MAGKKKEVSEESVAEVTTEETTPIEEVDLSKEKTDSITIMYRTRKGNSGVRTFTKEAHGDDFKTLAQSFAEKHNGELVK